MIDRIGSVMKVLKVAETDLIALCHGSCDCLASESDPVSLHRDTCPYRDFAQSLLWVQGCLGVLAVRQHKKDGPTYAELEATHDPLRPVYLKLVDPKVPPGGTRT